MTTTDHLLGGDGAPSSLLDAVDVLLNRGVLLEGDLVLGLADIDLVYLRLSTLLAAADRMLGSGAQAPAAAPDGAAAPLDAPPPPQPAAPRSPAAAATEPPRAASAPADGDTASVDALRNQIEQTLGRRGSGMLMDSADPGPSAPPMSNADAVGSASATGGEDAGGSARPASGDPQRSAAPAGESVTPPAPADGTRAQRWNAAPEDVERSVARLVLALVDFLRQLMERQAIRRMEQGTLSDTEVERLGQALMRLEQTVHAIARRFDLDPEDLSLDLGPLGTLT